MASRLDRLFTLLEQGQSSFVRRTAAFQIGEIVKTHPNELEPLLEKLKPLIISTSWETRIATSQTIECIMKNLPSTYIISSGALALDPDNCALLEDFDLDSILSTGAKLLGADTEKYDVKEDLSDIKNQRKLLYQKLGIDVGSAASIDTTHLFTDEDLIHNNGNHRSQSHTTTYTTTSTVKVNEILNKASKRKPTITTATIMQQNQEISIQSPSTPSYESKKIKLSTSTLKLQQQTSVLSSSGSGNNNELINSLDVLLRWLINNMFLPEWETRHGSATALREILKFMLSSNYLIINDLTRVYIEDLLIKILIVITLDRFADYVGDEVIAPVRETCSQIIGIISLKLNLRQLEYLLKIINNLIRYTDSWEIRHSGILTLKYIIASLEKNDNCLELILRHTFQYILTCIKDSDDDVRQVASQSLIPICERLNDLLRKINGNSNQDCENLIKILIDVLSDIDDLATSCTSIMILLSNLLKNTNNSKFLFTHINLLNSLLQRVYPFLQHNNLIVKQTTLNALNKIFELIALEKDKIENFFEKLFHTTLVSNLSLLFRLLYQQSIIECDLKCCQFIEQLWTRLCSILSLQQLINICYPYITTWLLLLMHSSSQPIEQSYLVQSEKLVEFSLNRQQQQQQQQHHRDNQNGNDNNGDNNGHHTYKEYIGGHMQKYEELKKRDQIIINCRVLAAHLLAILFNRINNDCISFLSDPALLASGTKPPIELVIQFLCSQINYKSGLNRFCFGLLMMEWGGLGETQPVATLSSQLITKILQFLDETTLYYDEIASSFTRIQKECKNLITLTHQHINKIPQLKQQVSNLFSLNVFTLEDAQSLVNFLRLNQTCLPNNLITIANEQIVQLSELVQKTINEQEQLQLRSSTTLASASISTKNLTEKMNPLIRPLVECVRLEYNEQIQTIAGKHLAILMQYCYQRQPNPVQKIFKNLHSILCNNREQTPQIAKMLNIQCDKTSFKINQKDFYEYNRFFGILSIKQMISDELNALQAQQQASLTPTLPSSVNNKQLKRRVSCASNTSETNESTTVSNLPNINDSINDDLQIQKLFIEKRGAEITISKICDIYQDNLDVIIPDLINQPLNSIEQFQSLTSTSSSNIDYAIYLCQNLETNQDLLQKYQDFVNQLQLIEHLCSNMCNLNKKYLHKFILKLDKLKIYLNHPLCAIRHMISRTLTQLCKKSLVDCMNVIIEFIIESLDNEIDIFSRQGSVEFVYNLLEKLNYDIVPYICLLIVPVLKRMTDLDWYIRTTASLCFATLIKLYPLEQSQILNLTNNENILRMQSEQKEFLQQLCDNKKIKEYKLSEDLIKTSLRSYQQAGVNWLAFLKRFNLHGILCDDMGLGKTLQSICILAGDYYEKNQNKHTFNEWIPSIIICPTTLTNHWYHEIKRFANPKYLKPFIYSGSISERDNLKRLFSSKNYNVLIASYDIVRHDIQFITSYQWNYCILDEGHLIKSTKTKLSKAIKQIYAAHRLILTGTPIQNNVCELWCLFDFLIPGYLGTEKQFHLKYARYIVPPGTTSTRTFERLCSQVAQQNDKKDSNGDSAKDFHQLSIVALESLHKQVLPFLLRRTKEEVLNDLPPKIIQDYYCEMSALQKELYQDFSRSSQASENNELKKAFLYDDDDSNETDEDSSSTASAPKLTEHVFQALQYLRKVVNHPSLVLKPSHPKWNKIQADLNAHYSGNLNDIRHSGKLLALKDLLHECGIGVENSEQQSVVNQHRVLIFCQLKAMIDIVEHELLKNMDNVSFLRLDGTIPASERYNIVHRFNSDPSIDILLLTTQIGGLGLNLTGADTVIFVEHDWNPQKDLQAMDRAHRIGQTKVVNVYRLITKKTLEEKIMSLQKFKMGIANSVVNIENSSLSSMGTEQLLDLFSKESSEVKSNLSHESSTSANTSNTPKVGGHSYQKLIENLNELWDEKQYENEYNLDNFIKSLNNNQN